MSGAVERARALLDVSRAAEAESALVTHLASAPEDGDAWLLLAAARVDLRRPQDALEAVAAAIRAGADGAWPHLLAANAYRLRGEHSLAVSAARRAVAEEPWLADAHYSLAHGLASVPKGLDMAQEAAREAARLAPTSAAPVALLARIALEQDRFDDAVTLGHQALALEPDDAVAAQVLASVHAVGRRFGAAGRGTAAVVAGDPRLGSRAPRLFWSLTYPAATAGAGTLLLAVGAMLLGLKMTEPGGTRDPSTLLAMASALYAIAALLALAGALVLGLRVQRLLREVPAPGRRAVLRSPSTPGVVLYVVLGLLVLAAAGATALALDPPTAERAMPPFATGFVVLGGIMLWQSAALARRARRAAGAGGSAR